MNLFGCCCVGKTTMAPNNRVTRKWELFAGRNKFYCDGLLMSAPHTGVFYLTCVLITGTSALFFAFDCPYLATKITPAIPIVGAVLYIFTMSSLLRTTFTDPGVIPRASHDEAAYIEKQIEVPNSLNSPTYRPPPRTKEVLVKGQTVKLKYCFTCKIFRPPRASHCSLCDNCVDRFDHHCPWVGNCVGKRNYRFFYMFLVSLAFLAVFIFSCSITHLVLLMKTGDEVFEVIKKAPFSVIVTAICFFSIWSVIGLAGFHTYLTTSDQTTNEDLKGSFSSKSGQRTVNPYSRGNICLNCFHILCGPMTPSLIDRRGIATDEFIQQMQQHSSHPRIPMSEITQSSMIVQQPKMEGPGETKPRLYDESTSLGVYRPQSYDNLQNGNSNSTAHLVENEHVPLSHLDVIHSPHSQTNTPNGHEITQTHDSTLDEVALQQQQQQLHQRPQKHSETDDDEDDDGDLTDNMDDGAGIESILDPKNPKKIKHNLSGSYNNLFRDNLDNSISLDLNSSDLIKSVVIGGHSILNNSENPTINYNLMKSASGSENVYSNILPVTAAQVQTSVVATAAAPKESETVDIETDPNLHLYSNINQENFVKSSKSTAQNNPLSTNNNIQSAYLESSDIMSSTLYNDDLDLDDPVQAFVNKSSLIPQSKSNISDGPEAHRLRLLHQSTMINTALDLDSIEDTSLGTSSQAAIV